MLISVSARSIPVLRFHQLGFLQQVKKEKGKEKENFLY